MGTVWVGNCLFRVQPRYHSAILNLNEYFAEIFLKFKEIESVTITGIQDATHKRSQYDVPWDLGKKVWKVSETA